MAVKNDLADIERDVGAMSMFLQCGEYTVKDLRGRHQDLKQLIDQLADLRSENEDWLENNVDGTRKYAKVEEETGALEDAEQALGEAEDEFLSMLSAKEFANYNPTEIICCLDRACEYLTEAMEV